MAIRDEMMEGSVSSLIIESLESNQQGDTLSLEDLAWVDSCLIKDPENSDSNWNAVKDALLEIVNLQAEQVSYSASGIDGMSEGTDIEMYHPGKEAETAESGKNDDDVVPIIVESKTNNDSHPVNQKAGISFSKLFEVDDTESETKNDSHSINQKTGIPFSELFEVNDTVETSDGDPFLPTYKEGERGSVSPDLGLDLDPFAVEIEPLSDDIFKVWDLGVPDEEDELITQLKKALAETSSASMPSTIDDSGTWEDESLDNLIAGVADLSLDSKSS